MTDTERSDPPLRASEVDTLLAYLDYHRDTLRQKTDGLSAEQLRATLAPSTMTLGGMVKHLALVETWWFNEVLLGNPQIEPWASVDWDADPDWDWHSADDDSPEQLRAMFDSAAAASDEIIAAAIAEGGLERLSVRESRRSEGAFSLRWIIVHMIEEYARHNGHADLLRESIDGVTGE
ncbi:MAG TPA: DinB family protein [Nocardioidaceae bacterium]|nr:DinB family protein [Nocardioidaceae bacterium]